MSEEHKQKKVNTLLCVDDDVTVDMISDYFIKQGYETFTAYSAQEALEVLSKHHIDLVMTGVVMPGMNGLELTKIIKKNYNSDVIIFTGYREGCSYEKAISVGAIDFFYKPFKLEDLHDSVRRNLGASEFYKYSQMNYHILCTDDTKEVGEAVVTCFRNYTNCRIEYVMDTNEVFKYLENNRVDLVITDQLRPDMDGLTMTNILTKKYPTKVIVCTGYGGTHEEAFRKGASAYVNKPFKIDTLLEVVYKVMVEDVTHIVMGND